MLTLGKKLLLKDQEKMLNVLTVEKNDANNSNFYVLIYFLSVPNNDIAH